MSRYDKAWETYKELENYNQIASLYMDDYKFADGKGLNETIEYCRKNLC